jgi:FAD/FMN-containing dehydrogenase
MVGEARLRRQHTNYVILYTGNLHLNIVADAYTPEIANALEPFIFELVGKLCNPIVHASTDMKADSEIKASMRGSVSAEHGVGLQKAHALHYSKNPVSVALMKQIKQLFDPRGIMNPGKVLI